MRELLLLLRRGRLPRHLLGHPLAPSSGCPHPQHAEGAAQDRCRHSRPRETAAPAQPAAVRHGAGLRHTRRAVGGGLPRSDGPGHPGKLAPGRYYKRQRPARLFGADDVLDHREERLLRARAHGAPIALQQLANSMVVRQPVPSLSEHRGRHRLRAQQAQADGPRPERVVGLAGAPNRPAGRHDRHPRTLRSVQRAEFHLLRPLVLPARARHGGDERPGARDEQPRRHARGRQIRHRLHRVLHRLQLPAGTIRGSHPGYPLRARQFQVLRPHPGGHHRRARFFGNRGLPSLVRLGRRLLELDHDGRRRLLLRPLHRLRPARRMPGVLECRRASLRRAVPAPRPRGGPEQLQPCGNGRYRAELGSHLGASRQPDVSLHARARHLRHLRQASRRAHAGIEHRNVAYGTAHPHVHALLPAQPGGERR